MSLNNDIKKLNKDGYLIIEKVLKKFYKKFIKNFYIIIQLYQILMRKEEQ